MGIRKTLATLVLAGGMVLGAGGAKANPIFYDGFENGTVGEQPVGWVVSGFDSDVESIVTDEISHNGKKSLHMNDPYSPEHTEVTRQFETNSSNIRVEWYGKSEGGISGMASVNGTNVFRFTGELEPSIPNITDHYVGVGWTDGPKLLDLDNSWFRFQIDIDTNLGNVSYRAMNMNTGEIGELLDQPYSSTPNSFNIKTAWDFGGGCFIDDVNITPEPATLGLLGLGAIGLKSRRKR